MRIHFSHPESDGKSSDVGVGGRFGILIKADNPPRSVNASHAQKTVEKQGEEHLSKSTLALYSTTDFFSKSLVFKHRGS